jgi:hypothetical protein
MAVNGKGLAGMGAKANGFERFLPRALKLSDL